MQSRQSINEILGQVIYQLWNVNIYILVLLLLRPKSIQTVEEVVWFETWYISKMNTSVSKLLMDMDSPLLAARMWCKWNIIMVSANSWQHTSMDTSSRITFSSQTVKEWHSSSREKYIMWPYITSMSTRWVHSSKRNLMNAVLNDHRWWSQRFLPISWMFLLWSSYDASWLPRHHHVFCVLYILYWWSMICIANKINPHRHIT